MQLVLRAFRLETPVLCPRRRCTCTYNHNQGLRNSWYTATQPKKAGERGCTNLAGRLESRRKEKGRTYGASPRTSHEEKNIHVPGISAVLRTESTFTGQNKHGKLPETRLNGCVCNYYENIPSFFSFFLTKTSEVSYLVATGVQRCPAT